MADKKNQRFTFDSERDGAEVPTLTSLLYKKNVVKSGGSPAKRKGGRPEDDHSRIVTLEPTLTMDTSTMGSMTGDSGAQLVISSLASTRGNPSASAEPVVVGEKRIVPAMRPYSPLAKVLQTKRPEAYEPGAVAAGGVRYLFRTAKPTNILVFQPATDTDNLVLSASVGLGSERNTIWNGMAFSKREFADLWGRLEKFGFAEYSTLGIAGQGNADRTGFRAAFQASSTEWVTFVRVKLITGGEALVVALTEGSIQALIPAFQTACLGAPAAKAA